MPVFLPDRGQNAFPRKKIEKNYNRNGRKSKSRCIIGICAGSRRRHFTANKERKMNLRRCAGHLVLGLAALLVAGGAQAQLGISNYEFSSVAVDYPAGGSVPNSLQGSLGQTMVTVDPPTNTGQNLAFLGFW